MLQYLKKFFNKEDIDYDNGYVKPNEFHSFYYFYLKAYRVIDTGDIPKWTLPSHLFMLTITIIALTLLTNTIIHGFLTLDLNYTTEGVSYFIVMTYTILILSCTRVNVPEYHVLQKIVREDFHYICSKGQQYRKKFFDEQLLTWKVCIISVIFTYAVAFGMAAFAFSSLILCIFTNYYEDSASRPLLFPFWIGDIDFKASPSFEISNTFAIICTAAYPYSFTFLLQTQIIWIREIAIKIDIITWRIHDLMNSIRPAKTKAEVKFYADKIKKEMSEIIQQHHSMYNLLENYTKIHIKLLMFEQKCSSPAICLTAYCTAEKFGKGEVNIILALMGFGIIVVYFIPSYLCTFMALKVHSICDVCWETPFWYAGPIIRPYFILMMQRSQRPLQLKIAGFEEVSLQTFSNRMTTAYSLFNMLRQTNL